MKRIVIGLLLVGISGCSTQTKQAEVETSKGELFAERGDWDTAVSCFTEAIQLDRDYAPAYMERGQAYEKQGELDKAISDFTTVIRQRPDISGPAHCFRGEIYLRQGKVDEAISDFTTAIRMAPERPESCLAYVGRAEAYRAKGETAKAAADTAKWKELYEKFGPSSP